MTEDYAIEVITAPPRTLAVTRFHAGFGELDAMGEKMGAAFGSVAAHLGDAGVAFEGPAVACYTPAGDGFDVAAGFPVAGSFDPGDGVDRLVLDGGEVAHTTHIGPYDQLPAAYAALRAGAEQLGRSLDDAATMWEEYWTGPEAPPEETRTEVFWPLESES